MKSKVEPERYFVVSDFEDGWGMEDIQCEEQLFSYCTEALFIPEEFIEELNVNDAYNLEIILSSIDLETVDEDWYVNLIKISKDS